MEYRIFKTFRHSIKIPFIIRLFFGVLFILISGVPIILPLFPWSLFFWVFLLIFWIILIVSPKKIKHVIKMRKSIIYLFKNIHKKNTIKHKIYDIKIHVMQILKK